MEQSGESQQPKRTRVSWKDNNVVKTFLEGSIQEINVNGREGGSLKALSWKNVAKILKDTRYFIVDRKQMRNHYDYLKSKYNAWLSLKIKTGNRYDPSTNMFNLTPEEWEEESKKNKLIDGLRTSPLPFPDLCTKLFEGSLATGVASFGPSSQQPEPTMEPFVVLSNDETEVSKHPGSSTPGCSSHTQVGSEKKSNQRMSDIDEHIINFIQAVTVKHANTNTNAPPTFAECLEKLNNLGLEKDDPVLRIGMAVINDVANREGWMAIPQEFAVGWIRTIGEKQGYK